MKRTLDSSISLVGLAIVAGGVLVLAGCSTTPEPQTPPPVTEDVPPAPVTIQTDTQVLHVLPQSDAQSYAIEVISRELGAALATRAPGKLIVTDSAANATCEFVSTLKKAEFSDSGWQHDKSEADSKPGAEGLVWIKFTRETKYQLEVDYIVKGNKPDAPDLKGTASGEASSLAYVKMEVPMAAAADPASVEIPEDPEKMPKSERELAEAAARGLIVEIADKIGAHFRGN